MSSYYGDPSQLQSERCDTCCTITTGVDTKVAEGTKKATAQNSPGVVMSTGQLCFSLDLMSVSAIGAGAWSFALNYLSGIGIYTLAGIGFNFTQGSVLTLGGGGAVLLNTSDNTLEIFTPVGGMPGQFSSAGNNTGSTLVQTNIGAADELFTLTMHNGTVAVYLGINGYISTPGQLISITDRYGNSQSFTWVNAFGLMQLTSATDSYGRTVQYSYYGSDGGFALAQIQDYLGRQLNFQYDDVGHLTAVVLPSINQAAEGNTFPGGTAYVFQYDTGNVRSERQDDLIAIWYPNQTLPYINTTSRSVNVGSVYSLALPRYALTYGQDPTDSDSWGKVLSIKSGDPTHGIGGTSNYSYVSDPLDLPTNLIDATDPIVFRGVSTDRNGNQTTYDFTANSMPARVEVLQSRSKLTISHTGFETVSWVTWTKYNAHNQPLAIVYPEGNSVEYTYEDGTVPTVGFYPARRGLKIVEKRRSDNGFGFTVYRSVTVPYAEFHETRWFYDPIFNEVCATIEARGNPIMYDTGMSSNVYFTPQNGTTTPTDSDRSAYTTLQYFDYQKNQTATITGNAALQALLGLDATDIGALITFVDDQMTATDGTGGIPVGFQTDLGDINGDGTGDGDSSGLAATPMIGRLVETQYPSATVIGSSSITTQTRIAIYTTNFQGQTTTSTDPEGNLTVFVRYPQNDPNGDGTVAPSLSGQQYGQVREVHVDADPDDVMDLVGASGDLVDFVPGIIARTNTEGIYQDLVSRYEGSSVGGGCSSCAYDSMGNPLAMTDPRGFTSITQRNEIGEVYSTISPEPYNFTVEMYYDANRNVTRTDTQDQQVKFASQDPTSPNYGHFTPSGSGSTAQVPMTPGPGGTLRPGWFTNLMQYNILDWKTQDDIDATGSIPASLKTQYDYDPNGNLIEIIKPMGNLVEYDYDERNLKIAQRIGYDPDNPTTAAITIFYYDNNGKLGSIIGPAERGTADNSLTATIADAFNSMSSLVHTGDWIVQNVYDGFDRVMQAIDAVGGTVDNTFDPGDRLIEAQQNGTVAGSTPIDRIGSGNELLSDVIMRFDEAGRQYEQQSNVFLTATVTLGSDRSVMHTGGGLATNSTANDHTGTATLTSGDSSYVLMRTVYDRAGRAVQTIADNTAVTTMAYDGANRQILVTDPLNNTTAMQYDGNGNAIFITRTDVCTITAPTTNNETFITFNRYDSLNRLVVSGMQGADGALASDLTVCCTWPVLPSTLFSQMGYDSRGNRTVTIDPKLNTTVTEYDGASRAIETDQLLRQNGDGSQGPDANASFQSGRRGVVRTQMLYDGNSRVFQMIDDRGNETLYTYDLQDRQVTMTFDDGSTRTNAYDTASDVVTYTDENGSVFANTFDCLGRKTTVAITPATDVSGTTAQSFQFDGLSRMTQFIDTISSTIAENDIVFDSLNRVLEDEQWYDGNTRFTTHDAFTSLVVTDLTYPNDRQTTNAYDALYRRTTVGDTGGSTIASWQFYGPSRVAEVVLANGLACTFMNNARTNSAVQAGGPSNPTWGDNSSDRLGYDGCGRMITKRYLSSSLNGSNGYSDTTAIVGFTTAFDRASNKVYERHIHAEERSHLYLPIDTNGNAGFGYDSLNRLRQYQRGTLASNGGIGGNGGGSITTPITLPGTDQTRSYTLDGLGNWKNTAYELVGGGGSPTATTEIRNHNDVNQITRINTNGTTQVFAYDHGNNTDGRKGNGNLSNDGTRSNIYDALNRLIQVMRVSDSAVIAAYTYDGMGRRIRKVVTNGGITGTIPNGTSDYLYDGQRIIEDRNGSNVAIKQYVWGRYIDELIQLRVISDTVNYYLLSDLLYRAVALTDSSGNIAETYDTDAYGNTICFSAAGTGGNWFADDATTTDNPICHYIFTGREYDLETGNYYSRGRVYGPSYGRFLQRDPILYRGGINLYQYVRGNPLISTDPMGTDPPAHWNIPDADVTFPGSGGSGGDPDPNYDQQMMNEAYNRASENWNAGNPGMAGHDFWYKQFQQWQKQYNVNKGGGGGAWISDYASFQITKGECCLVDDPKFAEADCSKKIEDRASALATPHFASLYPSWSWIGAGSMTAAAGFILKVAPGWWKATALIPTGIAAALTTEDAKDVALGYRIIAKGTEASAIYCNCKTAI